MAKGLKESKVAIFDIIYHIWDEVSGHAYFDPEEHETDYILGLGLESLAPVKHDPVYVDLVEEKGANVNVFLEYSDQDAFYQADHYVYNKSLTNKVFSNPVDSITSDDSDDVNLYAKWVQYIFKLISSYSQEFDTQTADEDKVFTLSTDTGWTILEVE